MHAHVQKRAGGRLIDLGDVRDHDGRRLEAFEAVDAAVARLAAEEIDAVEVRRDAGGRPVTFGDDAGRQLLVVEQARLADERLEAVAPGLGAEAGGGAAVVAGRADDGHVRTAVPLAFELDQGLDQQTLLLRLVAPVADLRRRLVVGPAHAFVARTHVAAAQRQLGHARRVAAVDAQPVADGAGAAPAQELIHAERRGVVDTLVLEVPEEPPDATLEATGDAEVEEVEVAGAQHVLSFVEHDLVVQEA